MGEALLIKYGGAGEHNPLDDIAVSADYCSILAVVRDSGGNKLPNIPIYCKDGGRWYNYTTNENGMSLFRCNSSSANIRTTNSSSIESYIMIDQRAPDVMNIDAVVGTKMMVNITFEKINGRIQLTGTRNNLRFMDTNEIKFMQMLGGGGASSYYAGGGGAAYNEAYNISIDRNTKYNTIAGNGGRGTGSSGATTSAFGYSAIGGSGGSGTGGIGGGSGSFKGGNGGAQYQNGGPSAYANSNFDYGGGGAGRCSFTYGQKYYSGYPVYEWNRYQNTWVAFQTVTNINVNTYSVNNGGDMSFYRDYPQNPTYYDGSNYINVSQFTVAGYDTRGYGNGGYGSGGGPWSADGNSFHVGYGGNGVVFIEI